MLIPFRLTAINTVTKNIIHLFIMMSFPKAFNAY